MAYLLDTNILSELVRHPGGQVARRIAEVGEGNICTSIVAAAELRYGGAKKSSARLIAQIEAVLGAIEILSLESPVDSAYGDLRVHLERAGTPIGANDLWIAAQAKAAGHVLVTANETEFRRVPGLQVQNWLRA
jgi:tRNA(fMet)-specific endonuclease VapC